MARRFPRWLALCSLVAAVLAIVVQLPHARAADAVVGTALTSAVWPLLDDHNPCTRDYADTGAVGATIQRKYNGAFELSDESVDGMAVSYSYDDDGLPTTVGELAVAPTS